MTRGLFIVVSAPSGTGKSTICQKLLQACPEIKFSVSYTSRPPRPNEVNGKDYHLFLVRNFSLVLIRVSLSNGWRITAIYTDLPGK